LWCFVDATPDGFKRYTRSVRSTEPPRYGVNVPIFGPFTARRLGELAAAAEQAGWDGFFCWDHLLWDPLGEGVTDTTVALTAIALATEKVTFGPLVTPLARRRPWKLAREVAALDVLSHGRFVLGVGNGDDVDFAPVGDPAPARQRAVVLDESIELLRRLLEDPKPVTHSGSAYHVEKVCLRPQPVQPRVPMWVGGWWPNRPPFRRAARLEGVFPIPKDDGAEPLAPHDLTACLDFISDHRGSDVRADPDYAVVIAGRTTGPADNRPAELVEHGATWWVEGFGPDDDVHEVEQRVLAGPPRA
jgi:alkanesulfonate monooxygenase SsuD/methylene tetrahydromethanopterin reductase-like flavin-dependent oxidoreductase (luciferase family)